LAWKDPPAAILSRSWLHLCGGEAASPADASCRRPGSIRLTRRVGGHSAARGLSPAKTSSSQVPSRRGFARLQPEPAGPGSDRECSERVVSGRPTGLGMAGVAMITAGLHPGRPRNPAGPTRVPPAPPGWARVLEGILGTALPAAARHQLPGIGAQHGRWREADLAIAIEPSRAQSQIRSGRQGLGNGSRVPQEALAAGLPPCLISGLLARKPWPAGQGLSRVRAAGLAEGCLSRMRGNCHSGPRFSTAGLAAPGWPQSVPAAGGCREYRSLSLSHRPLRGAQRPGCLASRTLLLARSARLLKGGQVVRAAVGSNRS